MDKIDDCQEGVITHFIENKHEVFKPNFSWWNAYSGAWTPIYLYYHYECLPYDFSHELVWRLKKDPDENSIPIFEYTEFVSMYFLRFLFFFVRCIFNIHTWFVPRYISKEWKKGALHRIKIENDVYQHGPAEY